jgi:hypothetical protein
MSPVRVGFIVGMYGSRALRVIMPRFAHDGGLLDGGDAPDYNLGDQAIGPAAGTFGKWSGR